MNQKTIEKLLKLPNGEDGNDFNWELYDKKGKLTVDYKSIFNEDDFETLISVVKDTGMWVEEEDDYKIRTKTGITEFQYIHCYRTLALYQKEETIDLFLAIFDLNTDNIDTDFHLEEFARIFMPFSNDEKVMQRLFDLFLVPMTAKNQSLQKAVSEFFEDFYLVTTTENQAIIEKIWIEKLSEKVEDDGSDDVYEKITINGFIVCGLLKTKLAAKHYELIKKLMEEGLINTEFCGNLEHIEVALGMRDASTVSKSIFSLMPDFDLDLPKQEPVVGAQNFNAQHTRKLIPKSDQKKNKNKKKAAKASKKKNRK